MLQELEDIKEKYRQLTLSLSDPAFIHDPKKIKKIAREHNVPIVQNPPLARALYQAVEVGAEVPANLYKAVAEVLAYVYRLKNQETPVE